MSKDNAGETALKLDELKLTRSVLKHIRKHKKTVKSGVGPGVDFARLSTGGDVIVTEGADFNPHIAWAKAMNNFYTSAGVCNGVRISALLPPDMEEPELKKFMSEFNALAEKYDVQLLGGNTCVSEAVTEAFYTVTAIGEADTDCVWMKPSEIKKTISQGLDIVMTGYTAALGTDLIIKNKSGELEKRFAKSYIADAVFGEEMYAVKAVTDVCRRHFSDYGIAYMHDVSYGGVYGALWQLATALRCGVEVDHYAIPIRQSTVEICEYFDVNPYLLEGTGALLIVCAEGERLVADLMSEGINAACLGRVNAGNEKYVLQSEKRFLTPVRSDEIYKIYNRKRGRCHEH